MVFEPVDMIINLKICANRRLGTNMKLPLGSSYIPRDGPKDGRRMLHMLLPPWDAANRAAA